MRYVHRDICTKSEKKCIRIKDESMKQKHMADLS